MRWIALSLLLAGCTLARVNEPPRVGLAQILIPRLESGEVAVYVFGLTSKHGVIGQPFAQTTSATFLSLSLSAGSYVLEVECRRPGAGVVLHGGIDFSISVKPDTVYKLDCAPTKEPTYGYPENNFSLAPAA